VVAGAALLVVLRDGLVAVNVNAYYQSMVVGLVLLIAIVVDRFRVRRLERSSGRHTERPLIPGTRIGMTTAPGDSIARVTAAAGDQSS